MPSFNDLDSYTGEFVQPMSLNIISNRKIWHCPLLNLPCSQLFGTLVEKQKSLDCNDYIFEDVNPELKYQGSDNQK